jgi:hypothetical protein
MTHQVAAQAPRLASKEPGAASPTIQGEVSASGFHTVGDTMPHTQIRQR